MITIIITIALVGLLTWLVTSLVPMPAQFKTAIYAVAGVGLLLYLLSVLGLWSAPGLHGRLLK